MTFARKQGRNGEPGLILVRGLGGIGKTTLSRRLSSRFVDFVPDASAVLLDCTGLPPRPDRASLLRLIGQAVANTPTAATLLTSTAKELDQLGLLVRRIQPPPDSSTEERKSWSELREAAQEFLSYFTATALERATVGVPTSGASSAVLAGFRALPSVVRGARSGLAVLLDQARAVGEIDEAEWIRGMDPDLLIFERFGEFISSLQLNDGPVLLVFDKAEGLLEQIPWLVELAMGASLARSVPLLLCLTGRIETVRMPDGSYISSEEFLRLLPYRSLDLPLQPFTQIEIAELIKQAFARNHRGKCPPVPGWLSDVCLDISAGLPLWAATVADRLTHSAFKTWEENEEAIRLSKRITTHGDEREVVSLLFRDLRVTGHEETDTFRLLAALTIAPDTIPRSTVCDAAGLPDTSMLRALTDSYGFMRGSQLHETARSVLRRYLASSPDGYKTAQSIAPLLLRYQEEHHAKNGPPLIGDETWEGFFADYIDLAFWHSPNLGISRVTNHSLAALPLRTRLVPILLERAAWFLQRLSITPNRTARVRTVARLAMPMLIGKALSAGLPDETSSSVYQVVVGAGYERRAFVASLGRALDRLAHDDATAPFLDESARLGLGIERLRWFVTQGFDEEALELVLSLSESGFDRISAGSALRQHVGRSILQLIDQLMASLAPEGHSERLSRIESITSLLDILAAISPRESALALARTQIRATVGQEQLGLLLDRLIQEASNFASDLSFLDALAGALLALGRTDDADRLFGLGLRASADWLTGWVGRIECAWSSDRLDQAVDLCTRALEVARNIDQSRLSPYGETRLHQLIHLSFEVFCLVGRPLDAHSRADLVPGVEGVISPYAMLISALSRSDVEGATYWLQLVLNSVEDQTDYLFEVALVHLLRGDRDAADEALAARRERRMSIFQEAFEHTLGKALARLEALPGDAVASFSTREGTEVNR